MAEEAAALVVDQVELVWMLSQIIQNSGAVLAFALVISIGAIGRWAGREQLPIHLRAIACRDCGAMSASSHFAFNREQHLLGASGALSE